MTTTTTTTTTSDQNAAYYTICDALVNYSSNSISIDSIVESIGAKDVDAVSDILSQFQRDWDAVECDSEGANSEQDAELDRIFSYYADKILDLILIECSPN